MKKITDNDVEEMIKGVQSNNILRDGLCGTDLREFDLTGLSVRMFKKLSFDENTIFSNEQLEKFKPYRLLESAKTASNSVEKLHNMGLTGNGIKIAIIDSNIDINYQPFKSANLNLIKTNKSGEMETHGATVLSALLQVVPEAEICYYADNKYSKNNDNNKLDYILDIVAKGDIKIISMSSGFSDENIKQQVHNLLNENNITLIDSETFHRNFTYCFREIDENGNESFKEAFCEEEQKDFIGIKSKLYSLLDNYNINKDNMEIAIAKLQSLLEQEGRVGLKGEIDRLKSILILMDKPVYGEDSVNYMYKQSEISKEQEERRKNDSIEIPCGGRTFIGKDGVYKYFGTCCVSYTIPQVAGIFVLAKQKYKDLTFEDFINLSKSTALNIDNRKVINPLNLILEVQKLKDERTQSDNFVHKLKENVYDVHDLFAKKQTGQEKESERLLRIKSGNINIEDELKK